MAITEKELIIPALRLIAEQTKGLSTTELIQLLRQELKPSDKDLEILKGRNDDVFSQKVRNLISHKSIEKYVEITDGKMKINDNGLSYLSSQIDKNIDEYSADIENNDDFREENTDCEFNFKMAEPDNIYLSVSDLKRKYDRAVNGNLENALILSPYYQRYDGIWSLKDKSLFIESIILNIPIPSIYLSEDSKGNLIVIDGRQRLSTLFEFMDEKKGFRLQGLSILKELNGCKFNKLVGDKEKFRSKIEDRSLHIAKLRYGTDETFIIETFERVNTKGAKLNAQEIRNAIHHGKSTDLLNDISDYYCGENRIIDKKRMKDKYIVLRYFAMQFFYSSICENKNVDFKSISDYLSKIMIKINSLNNEDIEELRKNFIIIYDRAKSIFKEKAFRLDEKLPINMILFEMTLIIVNELKNKTDKEIIDTFNSYLNWNAVDNLDRETSFEKNVKYHRDSKENIQDRLLFIKKIMRD